MSVEWRLLPRFLIRGTGFAIDLLDGLRMPESERIGMEFAAHAASVDQQRARFESDVFPCALRVEQGRDAPPDVFRDWYALNQLVRKRQACPEARRATLAPRIADVGTWIHTWNQSLAMAAAARVRLDAAVDRELVVARERLHALATDPRLQEALLLSNPEIYAVALPSYLKHYQRTARPARTRYLERQLFAYLQRFCAKNDTTSFFGPIDYGEFAECATEALAFEQRPSGAGGARLTRLTFWAAQALADAIAADAAVRPCLQPRLVDGCRVLASGDLQLTAANHRVAVPLHLQALLDVVDRANGEQSAEAVCAASGIADAWPALEELVRCGLVTLTLQIPTSDFDPLGWLQARVQQLPAEEWRIRLSQLRTMLARFTSASPDNKLQLLHELEVEFTRLTGVPARRGQGATYADRLVLYDEAQGDVARCTVGEPLTASLLARLGPIVDLCASYSAVVQDVCRQRARALFMQLGGGSPLPYLAFTRAVESQLPLESCLADPAVTSFLDELQGIARARHSGCDVHLSASDLQPLMRAVPPGSLISPDIFLAAIDAEHIRRGEYHLVVGEIHYGAQVWCHFLTFDDERAVVEEGLLELLGATSNGRTRANLVHRRQQGKTFYLELPGVSVEVRGRSAQCPRNILPVADLEVVARPDRLDLRSRSRDISLELYPGDPRAVSNWLFGTPPMLTPPIRFRTHTPRVRIGDATLWRARWELPIHEVLPAATHPSSSDLIAHASQLRHHHGLPQRCFARVPSERKPLFVDFWNPFSLELLFSVARDNPSVEFTEVLPTIDDWWLRRPGGAHSSEWRTTLVAVGTDD